MTTQLQQCREVAAALDEEVTEWRRKDAEWREQRNAAEKALRDMPFVMDNYRAALARAEAAEAERDAAARRAFSAEAENQRLEAENRRLTARVAELEAALAAQQWRPVTITEPSLNVMAELLIVGYRGHDGYWHYPDGPEGLVIRGWRPAPQEPTQ